MKQIESLFLGGVCVVVLASSLLAQPAPGSGERPGGNLRPPQRTQPLPPGVEALRDIEYVPAGHERQKLDLYLPKDGNKRPLIIWVHGGAWRAGSKANCPALPLLRDGYAVARIN